jgi:hypothetical protein
LDAEEVVSLDISWQLDNSNIGDRNKGLPSKLSLGLRVLQRWIPVESVVNQVLDVSRRRQISVETKK